MHCFFFFNDTATTEIYTLSLHDALPIFDEPSLGLDYNSQLAYQKKVRELATAGVAIVIASNQVDEIEALCDRVALDRKSTRLNSSHANISYAVFCLKKKIQTISITSIPV